VQNAGISLKVVGRDVLGFDDARFGLVNMQVQSNWIFQPTDKAMT
jgi:hypothetical protein